MEIRLVRPTFTQEEQVLGYRAEMLRFGSSFDGCAGLEGVEDYAQWLDFEGRLRRKYGAGYTPSEVFLAMAEETVAGIMDYRHPLTPFLLRYGGSIGYSVRPSLRGKGVAGQMLAQLLPICRQYGEERVLLTCDPKNAASRKTILRCGGVLENTVKDDVGLSDSGWIERYWIAL